MFHYITSVVAPGSLALKKPVNPKALYQFITHRRWFKKCSTVVGPTLKKLKINFLHIGLKLCFGCLEDRISFVLFG